jgi:hypothetical protein
VLVVGVPIVSKRLIAAAAVGAAIAHLAFTLAARAAVGFVFTLLGKGHFS